MVQIEILVSENQIQRIEYRLLKQKSRIGDLLFSTTADSNRNVINVERFWLNLGYISDNGNQKKISESSNFGQKKLGYLFQNSTKFVMEIFHFFMKGSVCLASVA